MRQVTVMERDVKDYIDQVGGAAKREDCHSLMKIMEEESGYRANLHGKIVGFGIHRYVHDNGRNGEAIVTGFMPRTQDICIYIMSGVSEHKQELEALGKYKAGKVCLYVRKLADIDEGALRQIIRDSVGLLQASCDCREAY